MNKELVLKYPNEFQHWLKGGEILVTSINDTTITWLHQDQLSESLWNLQRDFTFVINDEYVEFRQALAEGKTIQYQYYADQMNKTGIWRESIDEVFTMPVNRYRIKPEEPKFKKGDWVRDKVNCTIVKLTNHWSESGIELWEPMTGDVVIGWNDCSIRREIGRYEDAYPFDNCIPYIGQNFKEME